MVQRKKENMARVERAGIKKASHRKDMQDVIIAKMPTNKKHSLSAPPREIEGHLNYMSAELGFEGIKIDLITEVDWSRVNVSRRRGRAVHVYVLKPTVTIKNALADALCVIEGLEAQRDDLCNRLTLAINESERLRNDVVTLGMRMTSPQDKMLQDIEDERKLSMPLFETLDDILIDARKSLRDTVRQITDLTETVYRLRPTEPESYNR